MEFEWDDAKDRRTVGQRGFGFDHAIKIFAGRFIEWPDDRQDYGEVRMRAVGCVGEQMIHVVYTERGAVRRIISARPASRKERRLWQSFG